MPLLLDITQQIVNVHWEGLGKFAIGGTVRDATVEGPVGVFYTKEKSDSDETDKPMMFEHGHMGSAPAPPPPTDHQPAYAGGGGPRGTGMWYNNVVGMVGGKLKATTPGENDKTVLVAAGFRVDMIGLSGLYSDDRGLVLWHYNYQTKATLFYSEDDGKTWIETNCPITAPPDSENVNTQLQALYVAFDPEAQIFYADVQKVGQEGLGATPYVERTIISSGDGKSWSAGASHRQNIGGAAFTSPFIDKVMGIKNNGLTEVTNGATDPENLVTLTYTAVEAVEGAFGGGIRLQGPFKIEPAPTDEDGNPLPPGKGGIAIGNVPYGSRGTNMGFAYSNGSFLIAGSLILGEAEARGGDFTVLAYLSTDQGVTWKKTLDDASTFTIADTINWDPPFCAGSCGCAGA